MLKTEYDNYFGVGPRCFFERRDCEVNLTPETSLYFRCIICCATSGLFEDKICQVFVGGFPVRQFFFPRFFRFYLHLCSNPDSYPTLQISDFAVMMCAEDAPSASTAIFGGVFPVRFFLWHCATAHLYRFLFFAIFLPHFYEMSCNQQNPFGYMQTSSGSSSLFLILSKAVCADGPADKDVLYQSLRASRRRRWKRKTDSSGTLCPHFSLKHHTQSPRNFKF